jgi:hypothetical protein
MAPQRRGAVAAPSQLTQRSRPARYPAAHGSADERRDDRRAEVVARVASSTPDSLLVQHLDHNKDQGDQHQHYESDAF